MTKTNKKKGSLQLVQCNPSPLKPQNLNSFEETLFAPFLKYAVAAKLKDWAPHWSKFMTTRRGWRWCLFKSIRGLVKTWDYTRWLTIVMGLSTYQLNSSFEWTVPLKWPLNSPFPYGALKWWQEASESLFYLDQVPSCVAVQCVRLSVGGDVALRFKPQRGSQGFTAPCRSVWDQCSSSLSYCA